MKAKMQAFTPLIEKKVISKEVRKENIILGCIIS